jgi:hypothetical protein
MQNNAVEIPSEICGRCWEQTCTLSGR